MPQTNILVKKSENSSLQLGKTLATHKDVINSVISASYKG